MTTSGYVWNETFAARAARPHDVKGRLDAVGSSAATSVRHADDRLGHQEAANAPATRL